MRISFQNDKTGLLSELRCLLYCFDKIDFTLLLDEISAFNGILFH